MWHYFAYSHQHQPKSTKILKNTFQDKNKSITTFSKACGKLSNLKMDWNHHTTESNRKKREWWLSQKKLRAFESTTFSLLIPSKKELTNIQTWLMKNLKITSTLSQLEKSSIAQPQIKDNLWRNHLKKYHHLGTGENTMVYHLLRIKDNVEAAGLSPLLEA